MSVALALLLTWLVVLPSLFLLTVVVYPRYLRRHVARARMGSIPAIKPASRHGRRARPGI